MQESNYRYDRKEGLVEKFEDGAQQTTEYLDGEKHGLRRQVNEDGQLLLEQAWFRNRRHGLSTAYHSNGALASRGSYEHNFRAGDWTFWTEDGEIDEEQTRAYEAEQKSSAEKAASSADYVILETNP